MKKEKGNFEFIKDPKDNKKNYIFQKEKTTRNVTYFVSVVLVLLILAVVLSNFFFE